MEKAKLNLIVSEFASNCQAAFGDKLAEVRLFGSYARGDFDEESDIDIMVLFNALRPELKQYTNKVCEIAAEVDFKYGTWTSPILFSKPEYDANKKVSGFLKNVDREGVQIHAR